MALVGGVHDLKSDIFLNKIPNPKSLPAIVRQADSGEAGGPNPKLYESDKSQIEKLKSKTATFDY